MNPSPWHNDRHMVPRWRSLGATLKSRELGNPIAKKLADDKVGSLSPALLTRMERWNLAPTLITAAELVEACIVEGRQNDAVSAARRLVTIDKNAAPLIREQAAQLLKGTGNENDIPPDLDLSGLGIRRSARYFTKIHAQDPLSWVELSLAQTISGSPKAAKRSMSVALSLAPDNRHVLRSAARLFLHCEDPEQALKTIVRSPATRSDPWLIASEVALAQVAGRSSRFLKIGSGILEQGRYDPRQITELAGAAATEELRNGNRKKSRRWFTQSMVDPTGSALAQGEWAAPSLGGDLIAEARLNDAFENAEAVAYHLFRFRRLTEVAEACRSWSDNDPFSIRPFEFGSVTSSYVENFDEALSFAEGGLKIRPNSVILLNAYAFAAASLGRIDDALTALNKIKTHDANQQQRLVAMANSGLVSFRNNNFSEGRRLYSDAIEGFRKDGAHELAARAKIYLAREAMLACSDDWQALLKDAQESMKKFKESLGNETLKNVEKLAKDRLQSEPAQDNIAPVNEEVLQKPNVTVKFKFNSLTSHSLVRPNDWT